MMRRFFSVLRTFSILLVLVWLFVNAPPALSQATTPGKPLGYLRSYTGKSPYSLWKTQPLQRRLKALLGATEYEAFVYNLNPATSLAEQNGILHLEGNAPHNGGIEEAVLLVDVENDTLEVFLRHKETIVRAWAENHRTVPLPHDVMATLQPWPRAGLAQALAGLQQAGLQQAGLQQAGLQQAGGTSGARVPATSSQLATTRPAAFVPAPKICQSGTSCDEVNSFAATINDFRTSATDRYKIVTATVHITNKLSRPLILGLVQDSGVAIDDQGNRYTVNAASNVRGIGLIVSSTFDPKFLLQPGESSDARVEFALQMSRNVIYGTSWEASLTLREIDSVGTGQYRMGLEHSLRFPGLLTGLVNRPAARPASGSGASYSTANLSTSGNAAPQTSVAVIPATDPNACGGAPRCYSAGPFTATIASMTSSQVGNFKDHLLRLDIKFRNISNQPIILAYAASTSSAIDNLGNYYYWGHAGTHDGSVQGIGLAESQKADPHFILQPGETRSGTFQVVRYRPGNAQLGTSFTYSVTIDQLEVLPSQQIRTMRDYSLNYPDLTATAGFTGQGVNDSIKKLSDIFKKK